MEYSPEQTNENDIEGLIAKKKQIKEAHDKLAEKIINNQEVFDSPGIGPDVYKKLKDDESKWPEINGDIPGRVLRVDDLIDVFAANRIKVVSTDDHGAGSFFVVSAKKDGQVITENSLSPWQLQVVDGMDEELKNLIIMSKELHDVKLAINSMR